MRYVTSDAAIAKSPARRLNSLKPNFASFESRGNLASESNSSSASTVDMIPVKNSFAGIMHSPHTLLATRVASNDHATRHHSDAGSAWARLPQNVPRIRIG